MIHDVAKCNMDRHNASVSDSSCICCMRAWISYACGLTNMNLHLAKWHVPDLSGLDVGQQLRYSHLAGYESTHDFKSFWSLQMPSPSCKFHVILKLDRYVWSWSWGNVLRNLVSVDIGTTQFESDTRESWYLYCLHTCYIFLTDTCATCTFTIMLSAGRRNDVGILYLLSHAAWYGHQCFFFSRNIG